MQEISPTRSLARRRRDVASRARVGFTGSDRWLVSYADFITLLFAFFTTLYAISTVDARKFGAVGASLHVAFDATPPPITARGAGRGNGSALPGVLAYGEGIIEATLADVRDRVRVRLGREIAQGRVVLTSDRRGLVISLQEAGSFMSGRAELDDAATGALAELARSLADIANPLSVEGHTDDQPISTSRYASNWELSTARATAVVAVLSGAGIPPARLSAAGYGEFHPVAPNDTDAGRARNRRVDIVVLNPQTIPLNP